LKNAIEHKGKAKEGAIINSLFHEGLDKKNIILLGAGGVSKEVARLLASKNVKKHNKNKKEEFHAAVAYLLFLTKQARPDIQPAVLSLCTRAEKYNITD